jgi:hypothetical protein
MEIPDPWKILLLRDGRCPVNRSDSQTGGHNRPTVDFFSQEKGESRYEETIPDRTATSRAAVPPDRHGAKSRHPDEPSARADIVSLLQQGDKHISGGLPLPSQRSDVVVT